MRTAATVGAAFLLLLAWMQRDRVLTGRNDFAQLYAGATLSGSGKLYDEPANVQVFTRTSGVAMEGVVHYSRPPFYAALLKPLSYLPYLAAFGAFAVLNIVAAAWFVWRFQPIAAELPVFASMSLPLMAGIINGQDAALLLAIAGAGLLLFKSGRDFQAGLVWSLCSIKFHLFLPLPFVLLATRRWTAVKGGAVGGLVILAMSSATEGLQWVPQYASALLHSQLTPCIDCMPNIKGMANGWMLLEVAGSVVTVALLGIILWHRPRFEVAFGASIVAGLLLSQHAYVHDATLLLLPFSIFVGETSDKGLRGLMALATTPPLYLMLLARAPYSAAVSATCLVVLGLAYRSVQNSSASERRT